MGLWSWLFPSPEDRILKARRSLANGHPAEARLEVLDLDHPDAKVVIVEAENALVLLNLKAAVDLAWQGEDVRSAEHLELADEFHHGGHEEAIREARRQLREIRASRDAAEERKKNEEKARLLSADPLGFTGGPSYLDREASEAAFDPDREELEQRLALILEGYPPALKATAGALGSEFANAVLELDEGRPEDALRRLLALPDEAPLVAWERARAAWALNDPVGAVSALRSFSNLASGHHPMGNEHSGVFLASALVRTGDAPGAIRVLRDVTAGPKAPASATFLLARLLASTGQLVEADRMLVGLVKQHPKQPEIYALLARVRVEGGERVQAMRALEASLEAVCCTPGKCGSQKPDLDTHRLLATLYLEDGLERDRALELARVAAGLVQQPTWDDAYLQALVARAEGHPQAEALARRLLDATPKGTPLLDRARKLLPAPPDGVSAEG